MDAVNNTKRICWWDNIKFVMIVLVVAGHFADTLVAHSGLMKSFLSVHICFSYAGFPLYKRNVL